MKNLNNISMNVINNAWAIGFAYGKNDMHTTGFKE